MEDRISFLKYINYCYLKASDPNTIYIFKSGIFYIFLDEDAKVASDLFSLKLTNLNENVVKCENEIQSIDKYNKLLHKLSYKFKIIDTAQNKSFTIENFCLNEDIKELLEKISNINSDTLSVREAFDFIEETKQLAKSIMERNV